MWNLHVTYLAVLQNPFQSSIRAASTAVTTQQLTERRSTSTDTGVEIKEKSFTRGKCLYFRAKKCGLPNLNEAIVHSELPSLSCIHNTPQAPNGVDTIALSHAQKQSEWLR